MLINNNVYKEIISNQREIPPETGGILGGTKGRITIAVHDIGIQSEKKCSYTPNVEKMNQIIAEWKEKNIDFMGIYHSHFFGVDTLSEGDRKYIECIMKSMPKSINILYFPIIVMPQKVMVCYRAILNEERFTIEIDKSIVYE